MSILNFNAPDRLKKKPLRVVLGIGVIAGVIAIASTLAANININSGPVEFGQGVAQTTACDDAITVTPGSSFVNGDSSTAAFYLNSVTLTEIDSNVGRCAGKYFTIKAYDDSSSAPLEFFPGKNSLIFFDSGTAFSTLQSGIHVEFEDATGVSVYIHSPTLNASRIYKITVETSDTVAEEVPVFCSALGGVLDSQVCTVSSGVDISSDETIPSGYELKVLGNLTLDMNTGSLTNNGTISINSDYSGNNIIYLGTLINNGSLTNYTGEFNSGGILNNSSTGNIYNYGILPNNGNISNDGKIYNYGYFYVFHELSGSAPCIWDNTGYLENISVCPD